MTIISSGHIHPKSFEKIPDVNLVLAIVVKTRCFDNNIEGIFEVGIVTNFGVRFPDLTFIWGAIFELKVVFYVEMSRRARGFQR